MDVFEEFGAFFTDAFDERVPYRFFQAASGAVGKNKKLSLMGHTIKTGIGIGCKASAAISAQDGIGGEPINHS